MSILTKKERLERLIQDLLHAKPCADEQSVLQLIETTLDVIEDAFSGVVKNADHFNSRQTDGRMYAPHPAFKVPSKIEGCTCYRQAGHKTFIATNGAFRIVALTAQGEVMILDKEGADGQKIV